MENVADEHYVPYTPGEQAASRVGDATLDDLLGVWGCLRSRWGRDESVALLAALEPDSDTLRAVAERAWDLATVAINEYRPELREIYAEWGDDLKRVADRVDSDG